MPWWRKRFRLASVTGVGMENGWAVTDNGKPVALYRSRDEAKYIAKQANKRGGL